MTRSGYSDNCEYLDLYRASVDRSIKGKRGQAFLKELLSIMNATPFDKRTLIHGDLINDEGDCCAIGVVCKSRGLNVEGVDPYEPTEVAGLVGIARSMAAEIEFENDEGPPMETPNERWYRMRVWVESQVIKNE